MQQRRRVDLDAELGVEIAVRNPFNPAVVVAALADIVEFVVVADRELFAAAFAQIYCA
jgi:hypothetical protein